MHAPIKTRRVKSAHAPWLTDQIKYLSYQRDDLKKNPSDQTLNITIRLIKNAEIKLRNSLRNAKLNI